MKNLFILLLIIVAIILLQVYLSKKESKWYGLILPIITFSLSIFTIFNIALLGDESIFQIIFTVIYSFILANIPTCILLIIYYKFHNKLKIRS